uniref:Uncharacterized protein n=1 Tax=Anopheles epiroticus TaxID=199890 RepID=A0A182PJ62_9DIPT
MFASNLQPAKNPSVGDVLRSLPSPYSAKPSQEMGHFIREARKLPRNNTFINLEATKEESKERAGCYKPSLQRWNSVENLTSDQQAQERERNIVVQTVTVKPEPFTNGSDSNDDDSAEVRERHAVNRRCSMIPLMLPPAGRQKAAQCHTEKEKVFRRKPPVPPKGLAKHQDPIKIYRAERLQEKKLDLEQQLDEMKEQFASIELCRQKEEKRNRETFDLLKQEINGLKSTCEKLTDALERLQNEEDLFGKMKHEGEFSFYARSYEVSKKILSNTFRRRKGRTVPRPSCLQPSIAGTSCDTAQDIHEGEQGMCILKDSVDNSLPAMHEAGVPSGGDGDHNAGRAESGAPDTPMNIVTSMYYVSKIQSVAMDGNTSSEVNETGESI